GSDATDRGSGRERRRGTRRGSTATKLKIPFELALRGGKTEVTLPTGRTVRLNVPQGIDNGFKIKLKGNGADAGSGDIYVTFEVEPHPRFRRAGQDLLVDLEVTVFEAMLGSTRNLTGPLGQRLKVNVPP